MARRTRPTRQWTGLYYARQARGMSRSELVRLSGISKQQLSRLENGQIRLRLDHLKPFASHLGYTPEQILLWGRYPGTGGSHVESSDVLREETRARRAARPVARPGSRARHPRRPRRRRPAGARTPQGRTPCRPAQKRRLAVSNEFRARTAAHFAGAASGARYDRRQHGARRSFPASASSSIPGTRRRRPTGFMPSATRSTASSSSGCRCCARHARPASR